MGYSNEVVVTTIIEEPSLIWILLPVGVGLAYTVLEIALRKKYD